MCLFVADQRMCLITKMVPYVEPEVFRPNSMVDKFSHL